MRFKGKLAFLEGHHGVKQGNSSYATYSFSPYGENLLTISVIIGRI